MDGPYRFAWFRLPLERVMLATRSRFQSGQARCISVRNGPGARALTRMPYWATPAAAERIYAKSAASVEPWVECIWARPNPAAESMFRTAACWLSLRCGKASRIRKTAPRS
jgi:hypothetical protein